VSALALAHGGGVSEGLSLAVPLVALALYVLLQRSARRRAERGRDAAPKAPDRN
jgi:hypothetical protein